MEIGIGWEWRWGRECEDCESFLGRDRKKGQRVRRMNRNHQLARVGAIWRTCQRSGMGEATQESMVGGALAEIPRNGDMDSEMVTFCSQAVPRVE